MAHSDSEEEAADDLEFDRTTDADGDEDVEIDDDILDTIEGDAGVDDATEGDEVRRRLEILRLVDHNIPRRILYPMILKTVLTMTTTKILNSPGIPPWSTGNHPLLGLSLHPHPIHSKAKVGLYTAIHTVYTTHVSQGPSPERPIHTLTLSPAQLRKQALLRQDLHPPRSYTVEAICALPHPVPTHALASSLCMTHLLTGSEDGYIRDYDIFSAVNSKNFLTAPQRHHCGVVEGIMKAGQIRFWWENPGLKLNDISLLEEDLPLSPVYSLLMHSDALWALAGTDVCCLFSFVLTSITLSCRPVISTFSPYVMIPAGCAMS